MRERVRAPERKATITAPTPTPRASAVTRRSKANGTSVGQHRVRQHREPEHAPGGQEHPAGEKADHAQAFDEHRHEGEDDRDEGDHDGHDRGPGARGQAGVAHPRHARGQQADDEDQDGGHPVGQSCPPDAERHQHQQGQGEPRDRRHRPLVANDARDDDRLTIDLDRERPIEGSACRTLTAHEVGPVIVPSVGTARGHDLLPVGFERGHIDALQVVGGQRVRAVAGGIDVGRR